ncbi:hypothetical protein QWY93_10070 [Echinicola jeungdonensis]|uniref:Uncharacterized protein n=1 Tax=Echinicola jeungdonensis TaxID=709343 RepID=A0ABV5J7Q7_9BACT|nr:hypothetical protein [Echinicola jeungdonensis]MDN3669671.1 hypothetical protein [Echinicola jeungdonensis]
MKTSYFDYYKLILEKVRFDKRLWEKEYKKALRLLNKNEAKELREWVNQECFATSNVLNNNRYKLPQMRRPLEDQKRREQKEKAIL